MLTDDIKGSWKQLLTQALNFIDVKKTELSLFFFFFSDSMKLRG